MSSDITVLARTQHIIVDPASKAVSVINMGPQGIAGPAGVGGTASSTLVTDAGDWFVSNNVEDVLQEIGASLDVRDSTIVDHETRLNQIDVKISDNDSRLSATESATTANAQAISTNQSGQVLINQQLLTDITNNTNAIVSLGTRVTATEAFGPRLTTAENTIASHDTLISDQVDQIMDLQSRLASVEALLATTQTRLDDLETYAMVWKGQWATATDYVLNNVVGYSGGAYVCIQNHTSDATTEPEIGANWETAWDLLAA